MIMMPKPTYQAKEGGSAHIRELSVGSRGNQTKSQKIVKALKVKQNPRGKWRWRQRSLPLSTLAPVAHPLLFSILQDLVLGVHFVLFWRLRLYQSTMTIGRIYFIGKLLGHISSNATRLWGIYNFCHLLRGGGMWNWGCCMEKRSTKEGIWARGNFL